MPYKFVYDEKELVDFLRGIYGYFTLVREFPILLQGDYLTVEGRKRNNNLDLRTSIYLGLNSYKLGLPNLRKFPTKNINEDAFYVLDGSKEKIFVGKDHNNFLKINVGELLGAPPTPPFDVNSGLFEKDIKLYFGVTEEIINNLQDNLGAHSEIEVPIYLTLYKEKEEVESELFTEFAEKFIEEVKGITFEEIGGAKKAKEELEKIVISLINPDLYKRWGTKPVRGILLYGPPGTGKTLLARALAATADAVFYNVSIQHITSMWYGVSEKKIDSIFQHAKKQKKAIIFLDEIDAIAPSRDTAHEATARILSVLLTNLDGFKNLENVMCIGATNRIEAIDPALLRPGRLDRLILVPLPNKEERKEIFLIHFKKAESVANRKLFEVDLDKIAEITNNYSGADIAEIVRRTLENKIYEEIKRKEVTLVNTEDLEKEIEKYERNKKEKIKIGF